MFLQTGKCNTPFYALHKFFPTLPIICAQVVENIFCKIQEAGPLKLEKNVQSSNTLAIPADSYKFQTRLSFRGKIPVSYRQ